MRKTLLSNSKGNYLYQRFSFFTTKYEKSPLSHGDGVTKNKPNVGFGHTDDMQLLPQGIPGVPGCMHHEATGAIPCVQHSVLFFVDS